MALGLLWGDSISFQALEPICERRFIRGYSCGGVLAHLMTQEAKGPVGVSPLLSSPPLQHGGRSPPSLFLPGREAGRPPGAGAAEVQWRPGGDPHLPPGLPEQDRLPGIPAAVRGASARVRLEALEPIQTCRSRVPRACQGLGRSAGKGELGSTWCFG